MFHFFNQELVEGYNEVKEMSQQMMVEALFLRTQYILAKFQEALGGEWKVGTVRIKEMLKSEA